MKFKKFFAFILSAVLIMGEFCVPSFADEEDYNGENLNAILSSAGDGDTITLPGGVIRIDGNISLQGKNNLTIKSESETVITNTNPVTGWEESEINGVRAFRASADEKVTALYTGDDALQNARLPKTGYWYIDSADSSDSKGSGQDISSRGFYADDLTFSPAHPEDITVEILHQWVSEVDAMVSYDRSSGLVRMAEYTGRPIESGDRYYLFNVLESLDKPGEWAYDSSEGAIWYVPYDGETPGSVKLYAASDYKLLDISDCSGITFENIKFADTGWTYAGSEYLNQNIHTISIDYTKTSYQASVDVPGAVEVTYSDGIKFKNCEFENIGDTAIRLFTGAKNCTVDSCYFGNIGGNGIFIGGKFMQGDNVTNSEDDLAADITVRNCEIENYGTLFNGSCGITLTYADTADLINNEIHDGTYSGISAGYTWLFLDNPTENIHIKDNLIYNIGIDTMSDLGGIYMLGKQRGTVISGNVIHDCSCYSGESGYAGNGIYLDSGCEFMTIENNLVFNCSTSCFNTTLSKNNTVRNNIFAFGGQSVASLGLSEYGPFTDLDSAWTDNIFLTDNNVAAIEYMKEEGHFAGSGNIIWDISNGDELYFVKGQHDSDAITRETAEMRGYLSSAVFLDPGFEDAENYDFTLTDDSAAVKLGFEPFDYTKAGTVKGSTVGFSHNGGETAYNSDVSEYTQQQAEPGFFEKIKSFFYKIVEWFKSFLRIKYKDSDLIINDIYTTDYTAREKNENTDELASLIDEVKEHTPAYRVDESRKPFADDDRITAIYFDGEKCEGRDTEVFAYIGIPDGASKDNPVPAMVLVHGGGVHAQADWVQYWVDQGYAAISFDGFGQQPKSGEYSAEGNNNPDWTYNPDSHLPYSEFSDIDNDYTNQWFYFYLTDIVLSNNILRADERIITNEIGVSGISWGSLVTTVAACYDDRFEFAIPIYGCGCWEYMNFFVSDPKVLEKWDPTPLLKDVEMPIHYISSNADPFFYPDVLCGSAALTENGSVTMIDGLSHGAFKIEEAVRFANEYTGNGKTNIHITGAQEKNGKVTVSFILPDDVINTTVRIYYRSTPLEYENMKLKDSWQCKKVKASGNTAAVTIPSGTVMYYIDVSGNTGISSDTITATTGIYRCG